MMMNDENSEFEKKKIKETLTEMFELWCTGLDESNSLFRDTHRNYDETKRRGMIIWRSYFYPNHN